MRLFVVVGIADREERDCRPPCVAASANRTRAADAATWPNHVRSPANWWRAFFALGYWTGLRLPRTGDDCSRRRPRQEGDGEDAPADVRE